MACPAEGLPTHANSVQSVNPGPIQIQWWHRFGLAGPKPILYFQCQSMSRKRPIRSQCWLKGLGNKGHKDANQLPILSQSVPIPSEWKANLEPILSQHGKPMSNQSKANRRRIEGQSGANRVPILSQSRAKCLAILSRSRSNPNPILSQSFASRRPILCQSEAIPEPIEGQYLANRLPICC